MIRYLYDQSQEGTLTPEAARQMAARMLLAQTIGNSGYLYCIDSLGKVKVHPQPALLETDVSEFAFIQEQLARKIGYIEYDWKNPGETTPRPKALYMTYFAPWDWIVSASTYRDEFNSLVKIADFEKSVLQMRFGKTGYSFVIDGSGRILIHPKLKGVNLFKARDLPDQYLREMHARKSGKIVYPWKNPDETHPRMKLVIFNHIPEYDWVVASSSYLDEFYAPLHTVRNLIIATAVMTFLLVLPISFRIGASITQPLRDLMGHFDRMATGDFSSRMPSGTGDEIGQLATYYNRFADEIERHRNDLEKNMDHRRRVEEALRDSEARYRSVMEAAPDPIVVYDPIGRVTYFNAAFTRVFGWSLGECLGKKMDHFVPDENWKETNRMIAAVLSGETFSSIPTRRYTRDRNLVDVSISGATYHDRHGNLAGSVIILRDITKSQQLQLQVMEIGDRVRQRIGQDLHDDLCPHLIGIQGLGTVMVENLREDGSASLTLAEKMVDLMGAAIGKTRSLARGLCPVHLVSHGLQVALADIARQTQATAGLVCRFEDDETVVVTDNTVATHLYYIAREAVQNAVKHAQATLITIQLLHKGGHVHLRVMDNGSGIGSQADTAGIGLQIMHYRANMIGATFQINSNPETGTIVHVYLKTPPQRPHKPDTSKHDDRS
ncbi:cache domain-containing protein [Desulfosarcina cetonica]|uniref:cache domain-containing protein n=1 Tax=Desulfosarcina cetonica TaxID=90730 RepID=UPI00278C566F|nr:cache domain-containing protein [Desulfosarcina cetonica]